VHAEGIGAFLNRRTLSKLPGYHRIFGRATIDQRSLWEPNGNTT
jgi:hypothetical protein